MNWESLNQTTAIAAGCGTLLSLIYLLLVRKQNVAQGAMTAAEAVRIAIILVLASSAWALLCLAYLTTLEPFGAETSPDEYVIFYGIIVAFPTVTILSLFAQFVVRLLNRLTTYFSLELAHKRRVKRRATS